MCLGVILTECEPSQSFPHTTQIPTTPPQDIVAYTKNRDKSVVMAARTFLNTVGTRTPHFHVLYWPRS